MTSPRERKASVTKRPYLIVDFGKPLVNNASVLFTCSFMNLRVLGHRRVVVFGFFSMVFLLFIVACGYGEKCGKCERRRVGNLCVCGENVACPIRNIYCRLTSLFDMEWCRFSSVVLCEICELLVFDNSCTIINNRG